jgi:DNA-binding transcriptional regulator YiaG
MNKSFVFEGFGFPILLENVEFVSQDGEVYPNLNYEELAKKTMLYLVRSEHALTGNQVKFLRKQLGLSLEEFGKMLDVSHVAVIKWEAKENLATEMIYANEVLLRMNILKSLNEEREFLKDFIHLSSVRFLEVSSSIYIN